MTNPDVDASPGYEPDDRADVERVRAALDTTSTDGTDTEVALPPAGPQRSGGDYLIRSEEHLQVGTEKVATGRVFLRKYVVTEEKTITVSVSHEEVEMIREPIAPGTNLDDLTVTDGATEVILTEERIVISKEIVPVERVRLTIETITEQREITETVRQERIDVDDTSAAAGVSRLTAEDTARRSVHPRVQRRAELNRVALDTTPPATGDPAAPTYR